MKCLFLIYDEFGIVGRQIAGDKQRAIELWRAKNDETSYVGTLTAYSMANDKLPEDLFLAE